MTIETGPFDPAFYLDTPEAMLAYLEGVVIDGDAGEITDALGVVIRALDLRLHPELATAAPSGANR